MRIRVEGEGAGEGILDGVPYSGSLVNCRQPLHVLQVVKAIREQIGKQPGDTVHVEVWKDETTRTVDVPPPFKQAMKRAGVTTFFNSLSYTHQKEYCRWITEAKKEETRSGLIERTIGLLRAKLRTPR